jgi:NADH-quinone oxidoreductase subunit M
MSAAFALLISILLPLVGAMVIAVIGSQSPRLVRQVALAFAIVTLLLSLWVAARFDTSGDQYMQSVMAGDVTTETLDTAQTAFAVTQWQWIPAGTGVDVQFAVGLDGLSVWMYALSAILMLSALLVSWDAIQDRVALFYGMLLLLEAGCLGVFAARDIILFYVFFEFTLIPLFFLIGIWGSEQRRYAATKFFLYTLVGSLLTFLGLLTIMLWQQSSSAQETLIASIPALTLGLLQHPMSATMQLWVFLALFAGFAIKVPLFPLHTWLPLAHVQAPTAGSVFLAGILLKIGTYGFLRFSIPMLPDATVACVPWIMWLAVIGIIYGALVALVQSDIKRLIAYSSVSHLGFCMLGLFALNPLGLHGGALQMVNHGISTGALFALVGMLYERYHTREISQFGGLARRMPIMAFFMVLFTFSSIGLPGLNGFAGEIMILTGAFQRGWADSAGELATHLRWVSVLAVSGVVLGAWYMLWLVQRVFFGPVKEPPTHHEVHDLSAREIVVLLPLAVLTFWIGLYPQFFLNRMTPALMHSTSSAVAIMDSAASPASIATEQPAKETLSRAY